MLQIPRAVTLTVLALATAIFGSSPVAADFNSPLTREMLQGLLQTASDGFSGIAVAKGVDLSNRYSDRFIVDPIQLWRTRWRLLLRRHALCLGRMDLSHSDRFFSGHDKST